MSLINLADEGYRSEYTGKVVRRVLISDDLFIIEFMDDEYIVVEPAREHRFKLDISEGELD